jgi:hypothetical protein
MDGRRPVRYRAFEPIAGERYAVVTSSVIGRFTGRYDGFKHYGGFPLHVFHEGTSHFYVPEHQLRSFVKVH